MHGLQRTEGRRSSTATRPLRAVFFVALAALLFTLAIGGVAQGATDPMIATVGDMGCSQWDADYNNGNGTATRCRQRYVSDLLLNPAPAALLDLGDNQYESGQLAEFQTVYDPTFGRANGVVYPSIGNAEYETPNAQGFFDYFSNAGVAARILATTGADASHWSSGYYSFDIGAWHAIALNSNCTKVSCAAGSPQETWLKSDLAAHPNRCTLAYWHHPRWNSGSLGNDSSTSAFWTDLYNAHADLALAGHGNHHYERFLPQAPNGTANAAGVREFIVSTGGEEHGTPPGTPGDPNTSQVRDYTSFGIMRLTLHATGYDWQFVPEVGGSFTDSGSATCDSASPQRPSAPTLSASAGDGSVHLSWNAPADGGAAISGYNLYRGTTAGGETLLRNVGNVTSTDDTALTNGTKYYYRVAAVNSVGEGTQSNEVSATPAPTPPSTPFPSTPVLDSFAAGAGALSASWQSPALADGGTVAVRAGNVTASSSGAGSATWKAATFAADQEVYVTVPTLPSAGGFMQLAGRVSNLTSSSVSCYFLRVTPSTSTWDLRKKVNGAASSSMKTFSAPFAGGDSAGLRIVGSTITAYRKPAGGSWAPVVSATDTAIPGSGYLSFTLGDTTIRGGAFGGGSVSASAAQRPAAPTLSATAGDGAVNLSWSAPADGGAAITAYNIYRGTATGAETLLKSVANVTSTADTTVANGTKYYYRVAAVNSVGEGTLSNEVSATPAAPPPPATFPRTTVLDDFARPAGGLGLSWQSPALQDPGLASIASSGLTASGSGASSATWNMSFAANQEAYLSVPTLPRAGAFFQVAARVSNQGTSTVSCYFLRVTPSTSTWDLRLKLNGAASSSIKTFSAPFAAGDAAGLQVVGSTITAYRKPALGAWTSVGSTADTAIAGAGYISFTLGDTTMRGGAFGGGTVN
jgi:acid phosphatase type 7